MTSSEPQFVGVDVSHLALALDAEERRLQALAAADPDHLHHHETSRFSQGGEDGVIAEIFRRIGPGGRTFAELGASDGAENCTRALVEDGWTGVWVEGDTRAAEAARTVVGDRPVEVVHAFVDRDNIVDLLGATSLPAEPDLLVIDLDGNDLWIFEAVIARFRPRVVVLEYNSVLGPWEHWVMPYDRNHRWDRTWRFGASLAAQVESCARHGYRLVGCDRLGVNAFYVRDDLVSHFSSYDARQHYVGPRYHLPYGHPSLPPVGPLDASARVEASQLRLDVSMPAQRELAPGERVYFEAAVTSSAAGIVGESVERPVRVAAWWNGPSGAVGGEPLRCIQPWQVEPGDVRALVGFAIAPDEAGTYDLHVGLVQEGVAWFDPPARRPGGTWSVRGTRS